MNEGGCSGLRSTTGRRCEYCQLHEEDDDYLSFHVEHIIAKKHGGTDDPELLCFSCAQCNWAKGPNIAGLLDGKIYPLFNPRKQSWKRHFQWENTTLVGRTNTGKVTIQVLNINEPSRLMLRENLLFDDRFPPNES